MEIEKLSVNKITQGDRKTFKEFFEDFYPSCCVFAYRYLKDLDLAQDVAQESFIEFWKKKEHFNDIKTIKGFIYTVIRNKCLNHIKAKNIHENILNNEFSGDSFFYELILEEETYRIVNQAVNKLAPQMQRIVLLSMAGNTNQKIAELLSISLNTVKTLKKNAYKELRLQLKDHVFILFLISYILN